LLFLHENQLLDASSCQDIDFLTVGNYILVKGSASISFLKIQNKRKMAICAPKTSEFVTIKLSSRLMEIRNN
jgi:hypothetical protein